MCNSTSSLPTVVGFLDRDCRYKSAANQIPRVAELAPTLYASLNTSPSGMDPAPYSAVRVESTMLLPALPRGRDDRGSTYEKLSYNQLLKHN